jgi:tetratricopeptide (TPR) repeat protein
MGDLLRLAINNPQILSDEDFLASFVARQETAEDIIRRLRGITPRSLAKHRLILGQRGMGKTSLLRRIAMAVRDDPGLVEVLLPLTFREEQYNVHNLHTFWCNCLDALGDHFERTKQSEKAAELDRQVATLTRSSTGPASEDEGEQPLLVLKTWAKREGKRILLLIDNIDLIFDGLTKQHWALRRTLQEQGGIIVIGAATAYLEATSDPKGAFYDFFQVTVLERIGQDELLTCLRRLAGMRGDPGRRVLHILNTDPGRIRTLHDLTGGNLRTLILLYMLLERDADDEVMGDLERLLDEVTVLYKARVEDLAPQARVVLDAVALNWDPTTAAMVATITGMETSAVSAQLDRLFRSGILGKATLSTSVRAAFQLSERFFNIWYLMRHGPRRQRTRLRWLTGFLRGFYSPQQLTDKATSLLMRKDVNRHPMGHYCLALGEAVEDRSLRYLLVQEARRSLDLMAVQQGKRLEDIADPKDLPEPQSAQEWYEMGWWHHHRLDCPLEAESDYRKAIELDPKSAPPWTSLGNLLDRYTERYEEAEAAFRRAIDLDPKDAYTWTCLGNLLHRRRRRFDESEAAYRQAIEINPNFAFPWVNLGILLEQIRGRYEDAEIAFRKALEIDPNDAFPQISLGNLLRKRVGKVEEAEMVYRKAVEINPNYAYSWSSLGDLLQELPGRSVESEEAYRKAIAINPDYYYAWQSLGDLLRKQAERLEEAESIYRRVIEIKPDSAQAWQSLGALLGEQLGRAEDSEAAYRRAIEINPKNAYTWASLGDLLQVHMERFEESETAYQKAIEMDPNYAYPWLSLGDLLRVQGRYEESEEAYRRSIKIAPNSAYPWYGLGYLLQCHLERHREAEAAYRKALELDPRHLLSWFGLGNLLKDPLGKFHEAEAAHRKVIEIDPTFAHSWNSLGNLFQDHLGNTAEARQCYFSCLAVDPNNYFAITNLAYLLLKNGPSEEAENQCQLALKKLPSHGAALLRAFSALSHDNFGAAISAFQEALESGHSELAFTYFDDILRVLRLAKVKNYGEKLLGWLDESGLSDLHWPLRTAFDAFLHGEARLSDVNPEVGQSARRIYHWLTSTPPKDMEGKG